MHGQLLCVMLCLFLQIRKYSGWKMELLKWKLLFWEKSNNPALVLYTVCLLYMIFINKSLCCVFKNFYVYLFYWGNKYSHLFSQFAYWLCCLSWPHAGWAPWDVSVFALNAQACSQMTCCKTHWTGDQDPGVKWRICWGDKSPTHRKYVTSRVDMLLLYLVHSWDKQSLVAGESCQQQDRYCGMIHGHQSFLDLKMVIKPKHLLSQHLPARNVLWASTRFRQSNVPVRRCLILG